MRQGKSFLVDVLFVLALFGVFAVSALTLVTIGADVYQHTVQDMNYNYETRTAVAYITEKIRQNDISTTSGGNNACLTTLDNVPALMLTHTIDEEQYCTYLYFHEGYLKELYIQKGFSFGGNTLDAGTSVMELAALEMQQLTPQLFSIELTTTDNVSHQFYVSTHCDQ